MSLERWPAHLALAAALLAALSLGACGRKGGLDIPMSTDLAEPAPPPPPLPATEAGPPTLPGTPAPIAHNGFDSAGNPVAPAGRRKSFILDPLLY